MKQLFMAAVVLAIAFVAGPSVGYAEELSGAQVEALKGAGVTVYPGSVVVPGVQAMGVVLATSDGVELVREWYRENLSGWAVFDDGDMWVLYDGEAGLNPFQIMSKGQVMVDENANLPLVHGFDTGVTTEIVIIVP